MNCNCDQFIIHIYLCNEYKKIITSKKNLLKNILTFCSVEATTTIFAFSNCKNAFISMKKRLQILLRLLSNYAVICCLLKISPVLMKTYLNP